MATIETLKKELKQMKKNLKDAEAKLAAMEKLEKDNLTSRSSRPNKYQAA